MTFHSLGYIGIETSLYASLISSGRSSLRITVEACRRARSGEQTNLVTQATFTVVAIYDEKRPHPLPEPGSDRHRSGF